jgi:hypothetical protein
VAPAQEQQPVASSAAVLDPPAIAGAETDAPNPTPLTVETLHPTPIAGHRRAKVNYYACVRTEAFGDDIVQCIDMSRGGVGFKTKNP